MQLRLYDRKPEREGKRGLNKSQEKNLFKDF